MPQQWGVEDVIHGTRQDRGVTFVQIVSCVSMVYNVSLALACFKFRRRVGSSRGEEGGGSQPRRWSMWLRCVTTG